MPETVVGWCARCWACRGGIGGRNFYIWEGMTYYKYRIYEEYLYLYPQRRLPSLGLYIVTPNITYKKEREKEQSQVAPSLLRYLFIVVSLDVGVGPSIPASHLTSAMGPPFLMSFDLQVLELLRHLVVLNTETVREVGRLVVAGLPWVCRILGLLVGVQPFASWTAPIPRHGYPPPVSSLGRIVVDGVVCAVVGARFLGVYTRIVVVG